MISEVTFAKKFTSFWNEILPNAKNYVRLINGGLIEAIYEPFETADRKNNIALVNVMSFGMLRRYSKKVDSWAFLCSAKFFDSTSFDELLFESMSYLAKFSYGSECELPLSSKEKNQISHIFKLIFARHLAHGQRVIIDPSFDGCGFINESFGDLISGSVLVEIKSGERRFSVTDVRQVIIYLVLNHYSENPLMIDTVELFNPRMGIVFSEEIESFCKNLSALSSHELFSEVQKFIVDNNFVEVYDF
ncbi:hypothetical protein WH43_08285 [Rheinheimera sp. KL1]|uniref:hypothetical protein n=1 Tax=Rheinheimera sp. KL1 TaxID=1635005 RepID=UPI0006A96F61|nr:hypothetical protein [Rheinheimera sp. KL1]KOO58571.1 hypothetical protein WH43_08285 [Rheinheimera sp. KL1]